MEMNFLNQIEWYFSAKLLSIFQFYQKFIKNYISQKSYLNFKLLLFIQNLWYQSHKEILLNWLMEINSMDYSKIITHWVRESIFIEMVIRMKVRQVFILRYFLVWNEKWNRKIWVCINWINIWRLMA